MSRGAFSWLLLIALPLSVLAWAPPVNAQTQAIFYVAPDGDDNNPGTAAAPFKTLTQARNAARALNRTMTGDIVIYLRDGVYQLSDPIQFDPEDSGFNGHDINYRAYPNETPIISGGRPIRGWTLYDAARKIYSAPIDPSLQTRQLFVNGVRAVRARSTAIPPDLTQTTDGYTVTTSDLTAWSGLTGLEFVYHTNWTNPRCGIANITPQKIVMQQPCFANAQRNQQNSLNRPIWIENAFVFLDSPGEWFLDQAHSLIYYIPRAYENMASATVVAPALQTLLHGAGLAGQPLHNLIFEGLTFAYTTWLGPSTPDGFAEAQANYALVGSDASSGAMDNWQRPPAAVEFSAAHAIVFNQDVFAHLGAAGLALVAASQDNTVSASVFADISGVSVQIGGVATSDHHPATATDATARNTVTNNYIHNVGVEYKGAPGIVVGYANHTLISHNELADLPYTAISVGWGWGVVDPGGIYKTPTSAYSNTIESNYIHDFMTADLPDGGGIYTLSSQPDSLIQNNYLRSRLSMQGGIYLDQGTQHYTVSGNVFAVIAPWLYIWTASIQNNTARSNFSTRAIYINLGTNNTVTDIQSVTEGSAWPPAAQAVMDQAGLEPGVVRVTGK